MRRILEKPALFFAAMAVLCWCLFFAQSGKMALTDPDETFYAQTAREMLHRNEWSTPYLYGKPQFEKPILFYWLVEASYKLFGVNEFAARFPSAVLGTIGIVAIYLLGSLLFSRRAGILAAFMLGSSVEYVILARACVTDMTLATFMLLGALFFFYGHIKGLKLCYLLSAASFALATLTKGPVAILLAGASILIYLILVRDLKSLIKMPLIPMAFVFAAVAFPWYFLTYKLHGSSFIDAFFGFHNVTRFLEAEHKIGSQFYYNIPLVFGGFFPWSVFLPVAIWYAFKKVRKPGPECGNERRGMVFALVWFFVIFIFFSISSTKLPTYIFPSFISLALITGAFWDNFLKTQGAAKIGLGMKFSYYLLLAVVLLGSAGALIYIAYDYPIIFKGTFIALLFLASGITLSFITFLKRKFTWSFSFIVYSVVIFLLPFGMLAVPEIERYETSKDVSQKLLSLMKPDDKLASESNYLAGLAFYTGKSPENIDRHHDMVALLNLSSGRVWCVMKEKNHRQLYDPNINTVYVVPSYIVYKIGKRAIVTNSVPEGVKYIVKRERPQ